jgi:hypothetical protein
MRTIAALLALIAMTTAVSAQSLFERTRLDCSLEYGGVWNFVKFPPELEPLPPKKFTIKSIDLPRQTAIGGAGGAVVAVKGKRSIVFAVENTTLAVMAEETPSGFPLIWTNIEAQRAGFCH